MRRVALALLAPVSSPAAAQVPMDAAERAQMESELLDLKRRIEAIEARLSAAPAAPAASAQPASAAAPAVAVADASTSPTPPTPLLETVDARRNPFLSDDEPGKGFELAGGDHGALTFKGWLFDDRLRDLWFVWTRNTSAGEGGQGSMFTSDFLLAF